MFFWPPVGETTKPVSCVVSRGGGGGGFSGGVLSVSIPAFYVILRVTPTPNAGVLRGRLCLAEEEEEEEESEREKKKKMPAKLHESPHTSLQGLQAEVEVTVEQNATKDPSWTNTVSSLDGCFRC